MWMWNYKQQNIACYLPHPYSIWNFGMILMQQDGALLPLGSEDPRLIFRIIIFKNIQNYTIMVHHHHRQTDNLP